MGCLADPSQSFHVLSKRVYAVFTTENPDVIITSSEAGKPKAKRPPTQKKGGNNASASTSG